jgi:thiol-disulfide isomerase/thioredoxin
MNTVALFALWLAIGPLMPVNEAAYSKLVTAQRGKVVAVNVWATWCVPCRKEMPALVALEKRHAAQGFRLILVSANEPEEEKAARQFLDSVGVSSQPYIKQAADDQRFIDAVDPKWSGALPATFVYDRSGKRVKSFFGEVDIRELESLIDKL